MQTVKNRKTVTKLRLIQWARFQDVQVSLEGSTLFTGVNGSGKSTILDAMTYLMTGNTQFNSAARDRERTVIGYVRGDTKSNGKNRYLRAGEVVSYIAMEFYSPIDNNTFVIGVCMESPNETDCKSYWFVLPDVKMEDIAFTSIQDKKMTVFPRNQLAVNGSPIKMSVFMSRDKGVAQVARAMGLRCDVVKYRKKLLKMMAFNPENNIDQFIQECVLEPGKVDSLKELREQRHKFEQLREMYESLKLSKRKLEELEKKTQEYETKNRNYHIREMMFSYQNLCAKKQEKEDIAFRMKALEVKLCAGERQKIGIEERWNRAHERLYTAQNNDAIKGVEESVRVLEEQIRNLDREIESRETSVARLMRVKQQFEQMENWLADQVNFIPQDLQNMKLLSEEAPDGDVKRESFLRVAEKVLNYQESLRESRIRGKDEISAMRGNISARESEIKNLEANKLVLPSEIDEAKKVLSREFERQGIHTEIRVFAELVNEVKPESWRKAIETFLGRKRFYIIMDGAYCLKAMEVLQEKKLYHANVVITDKLPESEVTRGSAAEVLSIPNIFARRYANYLLNGIHLCDTLEELHEHPQGGLMKNGMLAKSYAVSNMKLEKTRYYLGADAIKLQLEQLRWEQEEEKAALNNKIAEQNLIERQIKEIGEIEWKAEHYDFTAPMQLQADRAQQNSLKAQKQELETNPAFMAVLEERQKAQQQFDAVQKERDEIVGSIRSCEDELKREQDNQKRIAGEIYEAEQIYREKQEKFIELEPVMLEEYRRLREKSDTCVVIKVKTVNNQKAELDNCIREMENLQMGYARIAEIDLNRRGVSFIPFYRSHMKEISNVKLEEASAKLEQQSKILESAFMNDFVAEINEAVTNARMEIDLINRELRQLPFGNDTYRFAMEEKADRKEFFRICKKLGDLGSSEFYLSSARTDEELERDIQDFMNVILEEQNEKEYTDYRKYFTYDMKISSRQGEEEIEADLSRKQGSASNGEKQTPYFIILAASLMQCYPKDNCCVRLAFIDEAFSALSRERIEQMVKYFEENHFQVIYAAPPEKINSIGSFIQSTVSLVLTGRYTNMVEGLVKTDAVSME